MKKHNVKVRRQNRKNLMMRATLNGIEVFIPRWLRKDSPQVRAFIESGLKELADRVPPRPVQQISPREIRALVRTWAKHIGVRPRRVQLRAMVNKWGSCSSRENVTLNTALCWLPKHLAEYVVCHELVHLRVFNHGEAFRTTMSQYMPDWSEREQELDAFKLYR